VIFGARVEVLHNVVGLCFEKMVVTVFNEEVFDLFAADVALVFAIDPAERCVRFKV